MLDKVFLTRPFELNSTKKFLHHSPLMVAGKDHRLFLLLLTEWVFFNFDFEVQITGQNSQEVIRLQDFFPQVFSTITDFWLVITGPAF